MPFGRPCPSPLVAPAAADLSLWFCLVLNFSYVIAVWPLCHVSHLAECIRDSPLCLHVVCCFLLPSRLQVTLVTLQVDGVVAAEFELEYLLLEGHCYDVTTGQPPRGLQFTLGTSSSPVIVDTIVMANLVSNGRVRWGRGATFVWGTGLWGAVGILNLSEMKVHDGLDLVNIKTSVQFITGGDHIHVTS